MKITFVHRFQKIFTAGVAIALALVLFGWFLFPSQRLVGVITAILILIVYGFAGRSVSPNRVNHSLISPAIALGLIAGFIFAAEIILEYILLPKDNTTFGLIEFGSVFLLYFLSGLISAYRTNRIRNGVWSAVVTAMIATLIWVIVTLSVFYIFRGSAQQTQVFQAEGNYADFVQSGMSNFNTFIIEDFMGAVFFHALLGPMVASLLGWFGGMIGKLISRTRIN